MLAVGLMSGTSLDGVDAALIEIVPRGDGYALDVLRHLTEPFAPELREALLAALPPNGGSVPAAARLHNAVGTAFARAARRVAGAGRIGFVASHGQTLWHDGPAHVTLQVGDAFVIREALAATVVYDFRSADCAAGGHGAPLVPYVDALIFGGGEEDRVALNLGGIANATFLRRGGAPHEASAFDTGPGNMLLDGFVRERTGGELSFDRDGKLAAAGRVDPALLSGMLCDQYFALAPPKTTGRERFGSHFLARYGDGFARLSLEDGAATLTELTAVSVADAIAKTRFGGARVIAAGGGAHNRTLLARIAARLEAGCVETSDSMGMPVDAKEAVAFAVLGYETLRERAANAPAATGARHAVTLGAIAPHRLHELLAAIASECSGAA